MVGPRWGLVAAAAVALLPSLGADPAPYATPYARLVGKSKIELARSMHGGAMLHRDAPKASASCRRVGLSLDGQTIRDQNRSILIMVQTMTASKSNLCEGSRADWRDGMAQCLHLLTGLRVVAHNDDGTCADCGTFRRTACDEGGRPPALVVVLGGGEDKRMRFHCTNTYCGATGAPFVSTAGNSPPHDYLGGCDVYVLNRQGERILGDRYVDPAAKPPTRIAWLPILNPHAEIRGIYERSLLYTVGTPLEETVLPDVHRPRTVVRTPDWEYQKRTLEFLRKLDPRALGPFSLEFYGLRQPDLGDDWTAIVAEAESPRLRGKVRLHDSRVSHEIMMQAMTRASGLIHYSSGDRNPRVLYEALYFGLPVFVSVQSMPYIGLQCQPFVTLTDANATSAQLNADVRHFVKYLGDSEKYKAIVAETNVTGDVSLGGGEKHWHRKIHNAQDAIRKFVEEELDEHAVYANFCERFGLCAPQGLVRDPRTPWVHHGKCRRALRRFENWKHEPWGPAMDIKRAMGISKSVNCTLGYGSVCKEPCYRRNAREYKQLAPRQWRQSRYHAPGDPDNRHRDRAIASAALD
ncbi:hypothetical protein JL721_6991 [Aureococcus anophagefferens]|nr:hypothetical protein JL721_6991 [Aureococcus anophagefferens]